MPTSLKWMDRKFTFTTPVEVYPEVIERLRGAPARVEEHVRGLSREVLVRSDGRGWSIQQNIGHLLDLDEVHSGRVDDYLAGATLLRAADPNNRRTNEANHNQRRIEELVGAFRRGRGEFVRRLDSLAAADFARVAEHPRLRIAMRLIDMLEFTAQHDDYHLARITELRRLLASAI